jgi:choice-of-anchor C domain-containing protein
VSTCWVYSTQMRQRWRYWSVVNILALFSLCSMPLAIAQTNLITNGSFEEGVGMDDMFETTRLDTGNTQLTGWEFTPNLDYIGTYWQASKGQYSIEIPGQLGEGNLSQSFSTEVNKQYQLLFDLSGCPVHGICPGGVKKLTVSVGSQLQDFYFDVTGYDTDNMGWVEKSLFFSAQQAQTTLTFTGNNSALDNIRVFAVDKEKVMQSNCDISTDVLPDLVASQLEINGNSLSVKVDNIGWMSAPEGVKLRIYGNDPIDSDKVLDNIILDRLEPDTYQEITLDNLVDLENYAGLYAFVDADEIVDECSEPNNTAWKGASPDTAMPAECKIYGIGDKGKNHSQFAIFNVDSRIEKFETRKLGALYKGYDIEGLAIDTKTHRLYATSGSDTDAGKLRGHLYMVDAKTGALIPIGATGFEEVDSLAFTADGTLWGWAKEKGLITIDLTTGNGTLALSSDIEVEDLTVAPTKEVTVYGAVNTDLWVFKPKTGALSVVCDNLPGETESLEMLSDTRLLLGTHKGSSLQVFDVQTCEINHEVSIPTDKLSDIEGIAILTKDCPLGDLIETAIEMIKEEQEKNTDKVCLSSKLDSFKAGDPVEGVGTVHQGLIIRTSNGGTKALGEGKDSPRLYTTPRNGKDVKNGCIGNGFGDTEYVHDYTFEIEQGKMFSYFMLHLKDFGDLNKQNASAHSIFLVGYNASDEIVSIDSLDYSSKKGKAYRNGELLGKLSKIGDACKAQVGDVGNYQYQISGGGITKVKLEFYNNKTGNKPSDPNFAVSEVCFTTVPETEALPSQLLHSLPKNYIGEHIDEFINELKAREFSQIRGFIYEYLNGLPEGLIRILINMFPEKIFPRHSEKLLDDFIEGLQDKKLQNRFINKIPREFIVERLTIHLNDALSELRSPLVTIFSGKLFREQLSNIGSDMISDLVTDFEQKASDDLLIDIFNALPSYVLDELLDKL